MSNTLVIDTADRLFPLCEAWVCEQEDIGHPSQLEFGKGWSLVRKEWERVVQKLNMMDCTLLFVAHSVEKKIVKKHVEIDRTQPDLPKRGLDLLHDLSDLILYMGHDKEDNPKLYGKTREGLMVGCRGGIQIDGSKPTFETIGSEIKRVSGKTFQEFKPTILLFGPPKIGKSTLASTFPNPIIVDMENGYKFLNVPKKYLCGSWPTFLDICAEIANGGNAGSKTENKESK